MLWRSCLARSHRSHRWGLDCRCVSAFYGFNEIDGLQIAVHGPRGCAYHLNMLPVDAVRHQLLGYTRNTIAFSTGIGEESTVYGSSEHRLRQALLHLVELLKPRALGLINTCIPAIIGDDVDSIARDVEERTGVPIVVAHCEAFEDDRGQLNDYLEAMRRKLRGEELEVGIERCGRLTALRSVLEKVFQSVDGIDVDEDSVGFEVYGRLHYYEDIRGEVEEVAEVLGEAGIRVRVFPGCSYDDVKEVLRSGVFFVRRLRSVFRRIAHATGAKVITDVVHHRYAGIRGIERFYLDIGRALGREGEVEKAFMRRRSWFLSHVDRYRRLLAGRRMGVVATPTSLVGEIIELANLFGLEVPLVILKTEWHRRYGADENALSRLVSEIANRISSDYGCEVIIDPELRYEIDKLKRLDLVCVTLFSNSIETVLLYRREGVHAFTPGIHGFSLYRVSYRSMLRFGEAALKALSSPLPIRSLYTEFRFSEKLFPFLEDEVPYRLCFEEVLRYVWNKPYRP